MNFVFQVPFDYVCVGFLNKDFFPKETVMEVDSDEKMIRVYIGVKP